MGASTVLGVVRLTEITGRPEVTAGGVAEMGATTVLGAVEFTETLGKPEVTADGLAEIGASTVLEVDIGDRIAMVEFAEMMGRPELISLMIELGMMTMGASVVDGGGMVKLTDRFPTLALTPMLPVPPVRGAANVLVSSARDIHHMLHLPAIAEPTRPKARN